MAPRTQQAAALPVLAEYGRPLVHVPLRKRPSTESGSYSPVHRKLSGLSERVPQHVICVSSDPAR